MGCFTSVIHDGHEYQFKTGDDSCERFRIGDAVPWRLDCHSGRGHLMDGAYETSGPNDEGWGYFIVIRDHKIFDVVKRKQFKAEDNDLQYEFEEEAAMRLGIQSPKREWWTERAWELQAKADKILHDENQARTPKTGNALLRILSVPLYDQPINKEWAAVLDEIRKEPIPGQNPEFK